MGVHFPRDIQQYRISPYINFKSNVCFGIQTMCVSYLQEMQQQMSFLNNPKQNMPDMSELFTSWFGGGQQPKKQAIRQKQLNKKRQ